jgi:hypothetical protein
MSRDIVVIGASSGGLKVLQSIVGGLPQNLPASIFIVVHIAPEAKSRLPAILMRSGALPAKHAQDNEAIRLGHIYELRQIFIFYYGKAKCVSCADRQVSRRRFEFEGKFSKELCRCCYPFALGIWHVRFGRT